MKAILKKLSSFQLILLGFAAVILTGALLLMLPISTASGESAAFSDALFTSVSAVCVTGLITQDTATYWSQFGQTIILLLIQVGGLGVVTAASAIALIAKRRINLRQRSTMQEATSAQQVGGVVKFTSFIFKTTFLIELIGVILLMPVFCRDFGFLKGLWYSLFHSISAFCNAGFDLLGVRTQFSSLTTYAANPLLNIVVMFLIISGGLGFATWEDIRIHRHYIKKYRMQSKVILVTTGILLFVPMLYFYFCEFAGWEMSLPEKLLASAFQAVTPRTAGFNTVNFSDMYQSSLCVIIILMLIGGSSGSTAGGMKTNTLAVLVSSAVSVFKRREDTNFFGRRIESDTLHRAAAILMLYLSLFLTSGIAISRIENLPLTDCMFEAASAIGTVGLTTGITPQLSIASKIILMLLMFFGRVGGLTFIYAAYMHPKKSFSKLPLDKISVG